MHHLARVSLLASVVIGSVWLAAAPAQAYTAIYEFGDSLSDVGNVFIGSNQTIPGGPYFGGRFSNGPNWVDDLSQQLGLGPVRPALAGGNDFAFGGATTGTPLLAPPAAVPNVVQQVGLFSAASNGVAPSGALYTMWIGANDVFAALDAGQSEPQTRAAVASAAQTEAAAVLTLASQGARSFLIPLVPDLGKTPDALANGPADSAIATALSIFYNAALEADLAGQSLDLKFLDTFALLDAAVADPAKFSLTNVTDGCYAGPLSGGGLVCATPDQYLFWDGMHPTATADRLVADAALVELTGGVPEPGTWVMMLLGFAGVGFTAYRRNARPTLMAA